MSKATVSLKQKCHYKFKISFRIQHEIVAGLSFTSKVKRGPISDTDQIMIGSYPPGQHEFLFPKVRGRRETGERQARESREESS